MRNFNNIDMQKVIGGLGYLGNSAISDHFT